MSTESLHPDPPDPDPASATPASSAVPPGSDRRREWQGRELILDYALGTSILGLIPIARLFTLKLLLAGGLLLKMLWDVGRLWRFRKGQDLLAIAGVLFGALGALAMAFMAWLTLVGLGVFVPYLKGLALSAALFTLTWGMGQAINQFYASSQQE